MTGILAERSQEKRRVGEALIREADSLACQSWNERMWSDGGPAQPSPTIGQAINGGLRPHQSAMAACFVIWREISRTAFWDFCNTIGT
jgi:hypothetical protein